MEMSSSTEFVEVSAADSASLACCCCCCCCCCAASRCDAAAITSWPSAVAAPLGTTGAEAAASTPALGRGRFFFITAARAGVLLLLPPLPPGDPPASADFLSPLLPATASSDPLLARPAGALPAPELDAAAVVAAAGAGGGAPSALSVAWKKWNSRSKARCCARRWRRSSSYGVRAKAPSSSSASSSTALGRRRVVALGASPELPTLGCWMPCIACDMLDGERMRRAGSGGRG